MCDAASVEEQLSRTGWTLGGLHPPFFVSLVASSIGLWGGSLSFLWFVGSSFITAPTPPIRRWSCRRCSSGDNRRPRRLVFAVLGLLKPARLLERLNRWVKNSWLLLNGATRYITSKFRSFEAGSLPLLCLSANSD